MTALLELRQIGLTYPNGVRALENVDLAIAPGELVGLVGESGSGKTSLARIALGLLAPTRGEVLLGGAPWAALARDRLALRRRVQMLLQDAAGSLSPRLTVGALLDEPLQIHRIPWRDGRARQDLLLQRLGLSPDIRDRYPHQISGGQARRVAIARALQVRPELLVADEPTAGLDVSARGGFLNLLLELHQDEGLTTILVSHDLAVIRRVTTRLLVLHRGALVEAGPTEAVFQHPQHPQTAALIAARPRLPAS
jgi:oligopeptide transport system ATP-binding protein